MLPVSKQSGLVHLHYQSELILVQNITRVELGYHTSAECLKCAYTWPLFG